MEEESRFLQAEFLKEDAFSPCLCLVHFLLPASCSVVNVLSQGSAASTGYHSGGRSLWGLRRISANLPGVKRSLISDRVGLKAKSHRCVGAASVSLLPLKACDFALLYRGLERGKTLQVVNTLVLLW